MSEWKPIATAPVGQRAFEIGRFPTSGHVSNISVAMTLDGLKSAWPDATHWRELTPETVAAATTPKQTA